MRSEQLLLTLLLFLALAAGSAWADEAPVDSSEDTSRPSNIEGWDVDPQEEEDNWTFFGIGFESRQAISGQNAAGATASALSGNKKGGARRGK